MALGIYGTALAQGGTKYDHKTTAYAFTVVSIMGCSSLYRITR